MPRPYRRADGRWTAYLEITTPTGKKVRRYVYAETRRDALEKQRALQRQQEAGANLAAPSQTVGQFLHHWLTEIVQRQNSPATYQSYREKTERYLLPYLGRYRLDKLTPEHVTTMMNAMQDQGLKPRTIAYTRAILRRALNIALRYGHITRNVATLVDPPTDEQPFVGRSLTPDEARQFLQAAVGHRHEALYRLTLALGLRKGEVINLRWVDADLQAGTLRIERSKTKRRTVTLSDSLIDLLATHWQYQQDERLARGDQWQEHGLIFPAERGTSLGGRNLSRHFKKMLRKAGLPDSIRFHDLRHSTASLLAAEGVHPRVVMDLLGHSQISTTMETYSHVFDPTQRAAVETLERLVFERSGVKSGVKRTEDARGNERGRTSSP